MIDTFLNQKFFTDQNIVTHVRTLCAAFHFSQLTGPRSGTGLLLYINTAEIKPHVIAEDHLQFRSLFQSEARVSQQEAHWHLNLHLFFLFFVSYVVSLLAWLMVETDNKFDKYFTYLLALFFVFLISFTFKNLVSLYINKRNSLILQISVWVQVWAAQSLWLDLSDVTCTSAFLEVWGYQLHWPQLA